MGRAWRIEYEGAFYHLISRGNDGQHIYLNDALWSKGFMTNEKVGQCFNMSYSAVSHSVKEFKEKMNKDEKVKNEFDEVNSQFKL